MRLVAHCLESRPRTEGADFGICQTFAASPAEPGELPCCLDLREAVYEALRETAFKERAKIHDIVLQGTSASAPQWNSPQTACLSSAAAPC